MPGRLRRVAPCGRLLGRDAGRTLSQPESVSYVAIDYPSGNTPHGVSDSLRRLNLPRSFELDLYTIEQDLQGILELLVFVR